MPGFRFCSWCNGKGCMCCDAEEKKWQAARDAEYQRLYPNGPTPIFTARRDNPKDMDLLKSVFGADRLREAFSPGGKGMTQILEDAARARSEQDPPVEYKPIGGD